MNSGVTEEIEIHQSTVSDWLSNPTQFGVVFSRYCSRMAQSVGYFIEIDEAAVALVTKTGTRNAPSGEVSASPTVSLCLL